MSTSNEIHDQEKQPDFSKVTKRKNSKKNIMKKIEILSKKTDEEILREINLEREHGSRVVCEYFLSDHTDRFYKYLLDNPPYTDNLNEWSDTWDFMCDEGFFSDNPNVLVGLFAYTINSNRLQDLKNLIDDRKNLVDDYTLYSFVVQYPDYSVWKSLATTLEVKVTCVFGAYDFDQIPFKFYEELINDIGIDEVLRSIKEDKHEYECWQIKGYVNQILNDMDFKDAQKKTGQKCPKITLREVNMNNH